MTDRSLTPADPAELHAALSHALRYDRSGRRTQDRASIMADVAAEHLIEALRLSGFVIMRSPINRSVSQTNEDPRPFRLSKDPDKRSS